MTVSSVTGPDPKETRPRWLSKTIVGVKAREVIMARALTEKTNTEQRESHTVSSSVPHESTCARCGGLMVPDFCLGVLGNIEVCEFAAKRCVQCGEVVDSVILLNRLLRQEPMTFQPARKTVSNNRVMNGRGGFALQAHGTGFRCARSLEDQTQQK